MNDKEKADRLLTLFREFVDGGYSRHDASQEATSSHLNGHQTGQHGEIALAYCGDYLVSFEGRGSIYKLIK